MSRFSSQPSWKLCYSNWSSGFHLSNVRGDMSENHWNQNRPAIMTWTCLGLDTHKKEVNINDNDRRVMTRMMLMDWRLFHSKEQSSWPHQRLMSIKSRPWKAQFKSNRWTCWLHLVCWSSCSHVWNQHHGSQKNVAAVVKTLDANKNMVRHYDVRCLSPTPSHSSKHRH